MPYQWMNQTAEITEKCVNWCASQHIAHYGNELMLIPRIVIFMLACHYLVNKYMLFLESKIDHPYHVYIGKFLDGLLLASVSMLAGWLYYFMTAYGG